MKDPSESKYQLLINGREKVGIENLKNPKPFNPTRKRRELIVFDDMIWNLIKN